MFERLKQLNKRQRRTVLLALLVVIAIAGVATFVGSPKVIQKDGEALRDAKTGKEIGRARKEFDGHAWRVFATVNLPEPTAGRSYHGWLTEPLSDETYYVGEFFPVQDGYSLSYSTEDDIRFFTAFQVSQEWADIPDQPSNSAAVWDFEVVMPSVSPSEEPQVEGAATELITEDGEVVDTADQPTPTPEE